jgi:hypothetical protein
MAPTLVFLLGGDELFLDAAVADVVGRVLPLISERVVAVYRRAINLARSSVAQAPSGAVTVAPPLVLRRSIQYNGT